METAVPQTPFKKTKINEIRCVAFKIDPQTLHAQDLSGAIHSRITVEKFVQPLILLIDDVVV